MLAYINFAFTYVLFFLTCTIWFIYFIGLFYKVPGKRSDFVRFPVYALIPAHNEDKVIFDTVTNLYNSGFRVVFVVADACTDNTVSEAIRGGASVVSVVRYNKFRALQDLIKHAQGFIHKGVCVFLDADNVVENNFVENLYKFYDGKDIIQLRLKNKNSGTVISRMYSFMFALSFQFQRGLYVLRRYNVLCGTAFIVPTVLLSFFYKFRVVSLTEDFEMTVRLLAFGVRVRLLDIPALCVYNENPMSWVVSFRQRLRWARGFLQVFHNNVKNIWRFPFLVLLSFLIVVYAFSLPFAFVSAFSVSYYMRFVPIWFILYLAVCFSYDKLKWYDFFVLPFFFFTSTLASFVAVLTCDRVKWFHTPHVFTVKKRVDVSVLRG